ncbi:hypothetical protein QQF64_035924 [Cirrhinus molitorella]|uniref:Uncharacterized protein n=1 Tax=Cirrhinus molitorella TaxID=172907 RepID=A0ABR3NHN1_9TELE
MQVYLGCDASGRERYFQYIPVNETLKAFLNNASVKEQYDKAKGQTSENPHVLQDVRDLVMLCREEDLKFFGQQQVFRPLLSDLKDMEEFGIVLENGETVRGTVIAIVGDNLGSHSIGGFTENFRERILSFFKYQHSRWGKEVRTILKDIDRDARDVDQGLAAVLLMMAHFKEKEESLFLSADVSDNNSGRCRDQAFTSINSKANHAWFIVRINPENSKCSSKLQLSRKNGKLV